MSDSSALNLRQDLGLSSDRLLNPEATQHDVSGRRDEQLAASGVTPEATRQAALITARYAPTSSDNALYEYGREPGTALEVGLGYGRQIDPGDDDDEAGWRSILDLAERGGATALEIGKAMWESHKFWERDISAGQRFWRAANVASLAIPFGVGSKAALGALSKIFPHALGGLAISNKGRVILTAASEATIAGGLEVLNPEGHSGSVVTSALIGAGFGAGGGALVARGARKARETAGRRARERLFNPDTVEDALRNDSWAIVQVADDESVAMAATREATALRYYDAEAKHAWLNKKEAPPKPGSATLDRIAARTAILMDNLSDAGFQPIAVRMPGGLDGIMIPGMIHDDAVQIAHVLGNKKVLTNRGEIDLVANKIRPTVEHKLGIATDLQNDKVYSYARKGTDGTGTDGYQHFVTRLSDDPVDYATGLPRHPVDDMLDETVQSRRFGAWFADFDSKQALSFMYRRLVNQYHGAYAFDAWANPGKRARARGGQRGVEDILDDKVITTDNGIQKMMQLFQGKWSGYADNAIRTGIRTWDTGMRFQSNAADESGEAFLSIMSAVPQSEQQDFIRYGTVLQQERFAEMGQEVAGPFRKETPEATLSYIRGEMARIIGGDKAKERRFVSTIQKVAAYNNALNRALLIPVGLVDEAQHTAMKAAAPLYLPSTRVRPDKRWFTTHEELDRGYLTVKRNAEIANPIKYAKADPKEMDQWVPWNHEIIMQTGAKARIAGQQEVYNHLAEIVESSPEWFGEFARVVDPEDLNLKPELYDVGGYTVKSSQYVGSDGATKGKFYVRGLRPDGAGGHREVWMELGSGNKAQALKESLESMGPQRLKLWARMMGEFAKLQRGGIVLDPTFGGKAVARDLPYAFISAGINPAAFLEGMVALVQDTKVVRTFGPATSKAKRMRNLIEMWRNQGGMKSALTSMDSNAIRELLRSSNMQQGAAQAIKGAVVRNPIDYPRAAAELLENSTRAGAFRRRLNGLIAEAEKRGQRIDPKVFLDEAAIYSREVSVDFQVRGAAELMTQMRVITAFFGATIQGMDQLRRAFVNDPMGVGGRMLAGITLPSVLLYMHNRRDPEYQQLSRAERNLFWHAKRPTSGPLGRMLGDDPESEADDKWLRFPKPFEPGLIAGSLVERFLEFVDENDPELLDHAYDEIIGQMAGGLVPVPSMLQPLLENKANIDSYTGSEIVPQGLVDVDPDMLNEGSGFAQGLSRMLNADVDDPSDKITPFEIDNVLRGWTGGLGMEAAGLADIALEAARRARGEPSPTAPAREFIETAPIIRAFVSSFPSGNQTMKDHYAYAERLRTVARTAQYLEDSMRIDDYVDYSMANATALGLQRGQAKVMGKIAKLRDQRRQVLALPTMDPQAKRDLIYTIDRAIMTYAEAYNNAYHELGLNPADPQSPITRQLRAIIGQPLEAR